MTARLLVATALLAVVVVCCSCGKRADKTTQADVPTDVAAVLDVGERAVPEAARAEPFFVQFYETPEPFEIEAKVPQYALPLEPEGIINWTVASRHFKCKRTAELILRNGFAVEEGWGDELGGIWTAYSLPDGVHRFVTVDTALHIQHLLHDMLVSELEQAYMVEDVRALTERALAWFDRAYEEGHRTAGASPKHLAAMRRNVAYFGVAAQLFGARAAVPDYVRDTVEAETRNIERGAVAASPIFIYPIDYGQFRPRGHYTKSEELERYFRAMMWYAHGAFLLEPGVVDQGTADIQTTQALLIARFIAEDPDAHTCWQRLHAFYEFIAGTVDDVSVADVCRVKTALDGELAAAGIDRQSLGGSAYLRMVRDRLRALPPPRIPSAIDAAELTRRRTSQQRAVRFLGQRFSLDGYAMSELTGFTYMGEGRPFTRIDTPMGPVRGYPTPLDVMAVLGSDEAEAILRAAGDAEYAHYDERLRQLKSELAALPDSQWHGNLAACRLDIVRALVDPIGEGYPTPMRTAVWKAHRLNTALATWTQLKRDLVLAQVQPVGRYTAGRLPRPCLDYVEPALAVYQRILATDRAVRNGLAVLLDDERKVSFLCERLVMFDGWVSGLERLARKELSDIPLDEKDGGFLEHSTRLTLSEMLMPLRRDLHDPAVVADVFTEPNEARVLEVATGRFNLLWVVYELPSGEKVLGAGPVMSYYEFKQPMAARLTDEEWRQILDQGDGPDPPGWTRSFLAREPKD